MVPTPQSDEEQKRQDDNTFRGSGSFPCSVRRLDNRSGLESIEVWIEDGELRCKYGKVCDTWISATDPGVVTGIGPIMVVAADFARDRRNLAEFGVEYEVKLDGETGIVTATTTCTNGKWVHVLQHAHWRGGEAPDYRWVDEIMIGRYPD